MELLLWLEQISIWRLQREQHSNPKREELDDTEDEELPVASYPNLEVVQ